MEPTPSTRSTSHDQQGRDAARRPTRPSGGRFYNETRATDLVPYLQPQARQGYQVWGRARPSKMKGAHDAQPESVYEKQMLLPTMDNRQPRDLVWADARFAVDIMREHALFFDILTPKVLAPEQKEEAQAFRESFNKLFVKIAEDGPPSAGDTKGFVRALRSEIQPFIDYKEENHRAQVQGDTRTLVWPLFFDHTRREAVRWLDRMDNIADGHVDLERPEVLKFWCSIMDEHARFVAHLVDPDEYELVAKAFEASDIFQALAHGKTGPVRALVKQPAAVVDSLIKNPELDAVESAAETLLDFKTEACRKIEGAKIRTIISPILADHVRREAVKFLDELHRTKEQ